MVRSKVKSINDITLVEESGHSTEGWPERNRMELGHILDILLRIGRRESDLVILFHSPEVCADHGQGLRKSLEVCARPRKPPMLRKPRFVQHQRFARNMAIKSMGRNFLSQFAQCNDCIITIVSCSL